MDEQQIKTTHELTEAESALLREYESAMTQVRLQMLDLKNRQQELEKGLAEAQHTARGTLLLIVRTNQLDGNWQPSPDFKTLVRTQ